MALHHRFPSGITPAAFILLTLPFFIVFRFVLQLYTVIDRFSVSFLLPF